MKPVANQPLLPVVEYKPAYHVVGIKEVHTLVPGQPMTSIADQWARFMQRIQEITGREAGAPTMGVCLSSPDGKPFDYVTGAVVPESSSSVPQGMDRWTLAPHTYAVFTHRGPISQLDGTYAAIHQWLNENDAYVRAQAPEMEFYDHRYISMEAADNEFDIYVPVTRK
ncbi:GyrI-like domain-containing protein [Paenibacillus rigui]|nr:GyrI-like domain-containing protein [Paenibacillus rigui]